MVQINFAQKSVNLKVVYYGPGMSGKTTNLEIIHQRAPEGNRGDLTSISTDGDRTLFFDYMPLDLGTVAGMRTAFQLYTVPGQVYYNSTRKLVLQGVDGVIFIADSSAAMMNQNLESLRNLEENLNEYGKSLATLPHVIQFNKRDLPDAMSVEELSRLLNPHNAPVFEAIANTGQGVFPTLKALAASVLRNVMNESGQKAASPAPAPAPAQRMAPPTAAPQRPQPTAAPRQPAAPFPQQYAAPAMAQGHAPQQYPPAAGAGFFPGQGQVPPPAQQVPGAGLQLAQPQHLSQTRSQPRPALNVAQPQARPAPQKAQPAPATRPQARPAAPAPSQKARPAPQKAPAPAPAPEKAKGSKGPILIVGGLAVGGVLAWVLMNVL
jgi:signal recognition particle receptor subunit beta